MKELTSHVYRMTLLVNVQVAFQSGLDRFLV